MDPSTWCLIVIYIGYWSLVDSLEWYVESTLELDYEGASILIGPSGPYYELIYIVALQEKGHYLHILSLLKVVYVNIFYLNGQL